MGVNHHPVVLASSISFGRIVAAAVLVEFGARVQNGCTSGHGICGLSRLSVRSAAAVGEFIVLYQLVIVLYAVVVPASASLAGMFMAAGFSVSTLMQTATDLGVDFVDLSPVPFDSSFSFEYRVASGSLLCLAFLTLAAHQKVFLTFVSCALEIASGFSFGCGLFISGMTRPAKVASFLTLSPTMFDPSLMFVMAGAIAVALPGFWFIIHWQTTDPPFRSFLNRSIDKDIQSNKPIDWKLASGSIMFGAGWGLLGICPGPAFVSLATLQPRIVAFCLSYAASFLFFEYVQPLLPSEVHFKKD